MVIKSLNVAQFKEFQPVVIGRQLENNYRQFIFNCSGFGNVASVMLVHQRSSDVAPYIVDSVSGDVLTWTVTDTDTSYAGSGQAELRITFTDGLAKSVIFRTVVLKSITADAVIPSALQSWYDAMIDYIDDHSISPDELGQAIEDYIAQHPISAPVTSVNSMIGDVVLTAADVGALPDSTTIPTKTSQLQNDSGFLTSAVTSFNGSSGAVTYSAPVSSVNGKTGTVTLSASDVGALPDSYTAPVASVDGKTGTVTILPTGGTTGQVLSKTSGTDYDVSWATPQGGGAVDSVNGQTGVVVLDASDVGALADNVSYVSSFNNATGAVTYTAPVSSVNTRTGAVTVDEIFWCTWGTTTSAQIETAIAAGQLPCVIYNDMTYTLRYRNSATNHRFVCNYGGKEFNLSCQSGAWLPGGTHTFLTTSYTPPVTSVNTKTGAVVLSASDVGALADNYTPPVTSVNGKTGAVSLTASDVSAMPDNYTPPVYYGVCSTAASTQNKEVTIAGITTLTTGLRIMVLMQNASNAGGPRLNVNNLGAVDIMETSATSARLYEWSAGSLLDFTYDGSHWMLTRGTIATTTYYGVTKLYGGYNSSDNGMAATAGALKSAYDTLNNNKASTAVATTSSAGLMSATDKTNLDAVVADYSSAINALGVE